MSDIYPERPQVTIRPLGVKDPGVETGEPDVPLSVPEAPQEPPEPEHIQFTPQAWDDPVPDLRQSFQAPEPLPPPPPPAPPPPPPQGVAAISQALDREVIPENARGITNTGEFTDENGQVISDEQPLPVEPGTQTAVLARMPRLRIPGMRQHPQQPPQQPPPPFGHNNPPPGQQLPPPRRIIHGHSDEPEFSWHRLYTQLFDDLHPMKQVEAEMVRRGGELQPDEQGYMLARLTRGSFGRTKQAIENSTFDFNTLQNNGPGLAQVLAPVAKNRTMLEQFEEYAVAMRDLELLDRGINPGAGVTRASAQAKVAAATPEMRSALQGLHGYQDRILQYMVDAGVVSEEAANNMRALNRSYVPFNRLMEKKPQDLNTSARNLKTFNPIKGMTGSDRDILSPIETIIRNTHYFIDLAEKNRALKAFELGANRRNMTDLLEPVPRGTRPTNVTREEVEKYLSDAGLTLPPGFQLAPDTFTIFRPNAFRPAHDEIAVFHDGKPRIYKVDPEIADAVNGMSEHQVSTLTKIVGAPSRWLRAGVVYSPEFLLRNPGRDQFTAAVQSTNYYIPVMSWLHGVGHMLGNTETWQNFLKSGGANSNFVSMDRKYLDEMVTNMTKSGLTSTIKNVLNPLQLGRILSELGEQPTRVGEFAQSQMRGKPMHKSAFEGREVSVDFQRRGSDPLVQSARRTVPFFGPQTQGPDRFIRAIKDNPTATMFKLGAWIGLPTLGAYVYNRQDPRMSDTPTYESDFYWEFPTDDWVGVTAEEAETIPDNWKKVGEDGAHYVNFGNIYKVPKNFEIGVWFGSIPERVLDSYFHKNPADFKKFAAALTGKNPDEIDNSYFNREAEPYKHAAKSAMDTILPNVVPQAFLTPGEVAANYSVFRGRKIVPDSIHNPENRRTEYTHYTTETAKYLGAAISKISPTTPLASPTLIEYWIRGWSGGLGEYALNLTDRAIKGVDTETFGRIPGIRQMVTGKPEKIEPERQWADTPAARAFISRLPTSSSRHIQDFYDNYDAARKSRQTIRRLGRLEGEEAADELRSESTEVSMNRTARAMSNQFKFIQRIMLENPKNPIGDVPMDAKEKRQLIDRTLLGINMMAQLANQRFYAAKKRRGSAVSDEENLPAPDLSQ